MFTKMSSRIIFAVMTICLLASGWVEVYSVKANQPQLGLNSEKPTRTPQLDNSILYLDPAIKDKINKEEINGTNCGTPTVLDDRWTDGFRLVCQNNLYVLMVDLTNPAVKVEVAASNSGLRTVSSFADSNTIAIINADYQFPGCSGTACSQGLTIVNGSNPTTYTNIAHLCSDARVRREIGFSQDGRVVVDWWYKFVSDSQARAWCGSIPENGGGQEGYANNLVGGGPQFTFDGQFRWECQYGMDANHNCLPSGDDVGINGEHFKQGDWWNRYQSAIGYSTDGQVLVIAESNNRTHTMQEVHDILYQRLQAYGKSLKNAFKFDGGHTAGFWYYNHSFDSTPGVTIPNVIRVQRTNSTCYSLSTNVSPGGGGNVNVQTSSNCAQGKFLPGTNVTLSASANSGYTFSNWSGDASGSSTSITIPMSSNKNVTANFSIIQTCYSVTRSVNPSNAGNINITPGPNCNGSQYTSGTNIQVSAVANQGYSFSNWSGDVSGTSSTTNLIVNGNKNIVANFSASQTCHSLTTTVLPVDSGFINQSPVPNCNGSQYISGTNVQLTAISNSGYKFSNWSGNANGSANPISIQINGPKTVIANFTPNQTESSRLFLPIVLNILGIKNGDFEQGNIAWEQYSSNGWQLILDRTALPITPHSGNWSAWLGGDFNEISSISQLVYVNPNSPYLTYWRLIGSEEVGCNYDTATIRVNGVVVQDFGLCKSFASDTWVNEIIDLRSFNGQNIELEFISSTDSSLNSNFFIDDITFQSTSYQFEAGFEESDSTNQNMEVGKIEYYGR